MQVTISTDNQQAILKLGGRFDFNAHSEFRAACDGALGNAAITQISIDLGGVDYLDSSALGMLLVLRDKANVAGKSLTLANAQGGVRQVLEIANFGKLFRLV